MGRVKKYVRKQAKRLGQYAKKRYAPAGKVDLAKIASDVWKLKNVINTELKHKDLNIASTSIPNTGIWYLTLLNGLDAQDGADPGERHGMSVRFKSLQIKGRVHATSESSQSAKRVRMVLFVDKEPLVAGLGTIPAISELYATNTVSGGYVNSMRSWQSLQQKRFTVLYDKVITLDDDYPEKAIKLYKKMNMVTQWQSGYIGGTAIANNALYLGFFTDDVSADATKFEFSSRVTFYDN